jgi:hypothetical protein
VRHFYISESKILFNPCLNELKNYILAVLNLTGGLCLYRTYSLNLGSSIFIQGVDLCALWNVVCGVK